MYIDREFLNPNTPVTIRFTEPIYKWVKETGEKENLSFNRVVLQCCKNAMEEDMVNCMQIKK